VKARPIAARLLAVSALTALSGAWVAAAAASPAAASGSTQLVGTFVIATGSCAHGGVSGSYLQMILPSGNANGPYMSNSDSSCSNQAVTPLSGGTEGGIITGEYQPTPNPPFDSHGDALAKKITAPAQYEGTAFATATEPVDPQTKSKVPVPTVTDTNGRLTGDLRSFGVTWNNQYFNQGSPKPNGSYPGGSKPVSGTYDASTGAFTLNWISQVVGGPFDKFSCSWHLSGQFQSAAKTTTTTTTTSSGHSGTSTGTSTSTGHTGGSTSTTTSTGSASGSTTTAGSGSTAGNNVPTPASGSHGSAGTTANGVAPQLASNQAASTSTVSKQTWHASWWLIAVASAIAVLGFGSLGLINRRLRGGPTPPTPPTSVPA
jgi:hypothetical protein